MPNKKYLYFNEEREETRKYAIETPADFPQRENFSSQEEFEKAGLQYIKDHDLSHEADVLDVSSDSSGVTDFWFSDK